MNVSVSDLFHLGEPEYYAVAEHLVSTPKETQTVRSYSRQLVQQKKMTTDQQKHLMMLWEENLNRVIPKHWIRELRIGCNQSLEDFKRNNSWTVTESHESDHPTALRDLYLMDGGEYVTWAKKVQHLTLPEQVLPVIKQELQESLLPLTQSNSTALRSRWQKWTYPKVLETCFVLLMGVMFHDTQRQSEVERLAKAWFKDWEQQNAFGAFQCPARVMYTTLVNRLFKTAKTDVSNAELMKQLKMLDRKVDETRDASLEGALSGRLSAGIQLNVYDRKKLQKVRTTDEDGNAELDPYALNVLMHDNNIVRYGNSVADMIEDERKHNLERRQR